MNITVSPYLVNFLKDPKIQRFAEEDNWKAVYEELSEKDHFYVTQLTQLLYLSDINPLKYMDIVPDSFANHLEINSLEIPDHIKKIGDSAFWGCDQLQSVTIPNSVTYIGALAFAYCSSLEDVILPGSIADIDTSAFRGCPRLKEITYLGPIAKWRGVRKAGAFNTNIIIHCADGDLQLQKNSWVRINHI